MSDVADEWLDGNSCWVSNSKKIGGTYVGEPRPFVGSVYRISEDGYCGISPEEAAAIKRTTRLNITHHVALGAMCNRDEDHLIVMKIISCYVKSLASSLNDIADTLTSRESSHRKLAMDCWRTVGLKTESNLRYRSELRRPAHGGCRSRILEWSNELPVLLAPECASRDVFRNRTPSPE